MINLLGYPFVIFVLFVPMLIIDMETKHVLKQIG